MSITNKLLLETLRWIKEFNLIENWDKVMVWISWWKDSLTLLDLLVKIRRYFDIKFDIIAMYIVPKIPEIKILSEELIKIFEWYWDEITYIIKEMNIPKESKLLKWIEEMKSCQWCTYTRRITLMKVAEKLWATKITFGHHMDDIVDTIFLNIVVWKNMKPMPVLNIMQKWDIAIIRPMVYVREKDIITYCKINWINPLSAWCPLDWESFRTDIRDAIDWLESKFPWFVENFFESYTKLLPIIDDKAKNKWINELSKK